MTYYHPSLTLKINTIKCINRIKPKVKDVILQFLFTFNVFESEFFKEQKCDDSKSGEKTDFRLVRERVDEIQSLCNADNYPLDLLENFQSHFSSVYIENNSWTERFRSLEKSESNKRGYDDKKMGYLYDFLTEPLAKNKKYAIKNALTISYTVRNNLFHGQKDIHELEKYEDDFKEIVEFLISLMKYLNKINANEF